MAIPQDELSEAVLLYGGPPFPDAEKVAQRFGESRSATIVSAVRAMIAEAMGLADMTAVLHEDLARIRAEMRNWHPGLSEAALEVIVNHVGYQTK